MCATMNGQFPVVEYLLEKGADIEAKDGCVRLSEVDMNTTHMSHVCEWQ